MQEELKNEDRRKWAQLLYTKHDNNIKDVALQVGVDEAAVRNWVKEGAWDGMKRSLLTSKVAQMERMYSVMEHLDAKMKNDNEVTVKHADLVLKYTAAIRNLEEETNVSVIMDVADLFVKWLRRKDVALTKKVTIQLDAFITEKLSLHTS